MVVALLGGAILPLRAAPAIDALFAATQGVAIALDVRTKELAAAHRLNTARTLQAPPGSTLKPISLLALLEADKLRTSETFPCSGKLRIAGRSFACSHPRTQMPMDLSTAIAYSCNEYVAHFAQRFDAGELAAMLTRYGLSSRTRFGGDAAEVVGKVNRAQGPDAKQLQAWGEDGVSGTALGLAAAYSRLSTMLAQPQFETIRRGMEDAVEFGTAQRAAISGIKVAGKTGSARDRATGESWAWFAGFAPSREPRALVVVLTRGKAGGADAAPIGGKILKAQLEGRL
jgi:cell division protein FtsI/penicillin-binding protein 2